MADRLAVDAPEAAAEGAAGSHRPPVVLPPNPEQRNETKRSRSLVRAWVFRLRGAGGL